MLTTVLSTNGWNTLTCISLQSNNVLKNLLLCESLMSTTAILKVSKQSPPFDSDVRPVPRTVNVSKSSRSQHMSEIFRKKMIRPIYSN